MEKLENLDGKQKTVTIGGVEYTLQMVAASAFMQAGKTYVDARGVVDTYKYAKWLLDNVVISPKVKIDDFTGRIRTLQKLTSACDSFLLGDGSDEENF